MQIFDNVINIVRDDLKAAIENEQRVQNPLCKGAFYGYKQW